MTEKDDGRALYNNVQKHIYKKQAERQSACFFIFTEDSFYLVESLTEHSVTEGL